MRPELLQMKTNPGNGKWGEGERRGAEEPGPGPRGEAVGWREREARWGSDAASSGEAEHGERRRPTARVLTS